MTPLPIWPRLIPLPDQPPRQNYGSLSRTDNTKKQYYWGQRHTSKSCMWSQVDSDNYLITKLENKTTSPLAHTYTVYIHPNPIQIHIYIWKRMPKLAKRKTCNTMVLQTTRPLGLATVRKTPNCMKRHNLGKKLNKSKFAHKISLNIQIRTKFSRRWNTALQRHVEKVKKHNLWKIQNSLIKPPKKFKIWDIFPTVLTQPCSGSNKGTISETSFSFWQYATKFTKIIILWIKEG